MTRNDVNFSLFADSAGRVYLIRKKPCPENNKVYELLCFTPDGQLIDKVLIRSNHFNVPLSFMYHEQIFIPNSADHTYFTVALRLWDKKWQDEIYWAFPSVGTPEDVCDFYVFLWRMYWREDHRSPVRSGYRYFRYHEYQQLQQRLKAAKAFPYQ